MPRTEKRFGVVNQPASTAVEELVPSAATTRNVLINVTARSAGTINAAIYSNEYTVSTSGSVAITGSSAINGSNFSTVNSTMVAAFALGKATPDVYVWNNSSTTGLMVIDPSTGSSKYFGGNNSNSAQRYWRAALDENVQFKEANSGSGTQTPRLNKGYVSVSATDAIGIAANQNTTATANSDMFDRVGITHTVGTSIDDNTDYNVGQTSFQGTNTTGGAITGGAYALQDGVGYLLQSGTDYVYQNTNNRVGLGLYIFSSSSSTFNKRAFWNCDGTSDKESAYALAYFVASDYNSTHGVFAFSQPSTTTLWSNISPTSSTSWPAGYALPSAAAPAGFRIVSNSGTTEPDVNFLTGTITYPSAPTGVTVPTLSINCPWQVCSLKFSPDGTRLAAAYSRNYSGSGDTNSVVVVYTRQNDGTWSHTHSSGSAIQWMPDNPDCMTWSADGGYIMVAASSSTSASVITTNGTYTISRWAVSGGSANVANTSVSTWTNASSEYPNFPSYISPTTGSSAVGSISISTSTMSGSTSANYVVYTLASSRSGSGIGTAHAAINSAATSVIPRVVSGFVHQASGTVGSSGNPATNYVTSVITDLDVAAGETVQVSNVVLHSGERIYVSASPTGSVDISAHGVEAS